MPIESGYTKKNATWTKVCVAFFFMFAIQKLIRSKQRISDFNLTNNCLDFGIVSWYCVANKLVMILV